MNARAIEASPTEAEFERGFLGVLIRAPELLGADLCGVGRDDLSNWRHRVVFEAARAVAARGAIDVALVAAELERRGQLDAVDGPEFLAELVEAAPFSEPLARTYAAAVRKAADDRRLVVAAQDAVAIRKERGPEAAAQFARETLEALAKRGSDPLAAIRAGIVADLEAGPEAIDAAAGPQWISYPRMPVAGARLAAAGGTGKTTAVLCEMVRIAAGLDFYGDNVDMPGPCAFISAEDGATYPRYLLRRILADGRDSGALSERAATMAKSAIRIIGWSRAKYGPLMRADEAGETHVCAVWPLLLELLAPLKPVYVTLDPSVLFGPGERHGNDALAAFAALMHETAQQISACVQTVDHVAQSVARNGTIDQYASRGGTGSVDESRLARQLVRVSEDATKALPPTVTPSDVTEGRILQMHWTKPSYAPTPAPVWLRRRGYWFEHLRAPSADDAAGQRMISANQRLQQAEAAVLAYVRERNAAGDRLGKRDIERSTIIDPATGDRLPVRAAAEAVRRMLAAGKLVRRELPAEQTAGYRKEYVDVAP